MVYSNTGVYGEMHMANTDHLSYSLYFKALNDAFKEYFSRL